MPRPLPIRSQVNGTRLNSLRVLFHLEEAPTLADRFMTSPEGWGKRCITRHCLLLERQTVGPAALLRCLKLCKGLKRNLYPLERIRVSRANLGACFLGLVVVWAVLRHLDRARCLKGDQRFSLQVWISMTSGFKE
jgi:hypothetical protein